MRQTRQTDHYCIQNGIKRVLQLHSFSNDHIKNKTLRSIKKSYSHDKNYKIFSSIVLHCLDTTVKQLKIFSSFYYVYSHNKN